MQVLVRVKSVTVDWNACVAVPENLTDLIIVFYVVLKVINSKLRAYLWLRDYLYAALNMVTTESAASS